MKKKHDQFFKVILQSTLNEKKLMLPPLFARSFSDQLCDVAHLSVVDGLFWHVRLEKVAVNEIFIHGSEWNDFVKHYSISQGYFLVFKYEGCGSSFQVSIFDFSTACEIQYPITNTTAHQNHVLNEDQNDRPSKRNHSSEVARKLAVKKKSNAGKETIKKRKPEMMDLVETSRGKKKRFGKRKSLSNENTNSKENPNECNLFTTRSEYAGITVSRKFLLTYMGIMHKEFHIPESFKPKNPSFMIVMTEKGLSRTYVFVVEAFVKKHMSRDLKHVTIQNSDGREWSMKVKWRVRSGLEISGCWTNFINYNHLKEGHVCAFELVKEDVLMVTIFRESA